MLNFRELPSFVKFHLRELGDSMLDHQPRGRGSNPHRAEIYFEIPASPVPHPQPIQL